MQNFKRRPTKTEAEQAKEAKRLETAARLDLGSCDDDYLVKLPRGWIASGKPLPGSYEEMVAMLAAEGIHI